MDKSPQIKIELINIQLGCMLKVARLKKNLSQHDLALTLDTNPTAIGRIERAEVISGWDKIFKLAEELQIDFAMLFSLQSKNHLLGLIEEIIHLEEKLTSEKEKYYSNLKQEVKEKFRKLSIL